MPSDRKNSTSLAIQFIITLVSSLITIKLNILNYGQNIFGSWIVLSSIWGFSTTIDFGFGTAIVKYVAQYKEQKEVLNKILSSIFYVFLFFGFILFTFCITIADFFYFNNISIVSSNYIEVFKYVFFILGISFLCQYLSIFFKSILEGLNNFTITSVISIGQYLLILSGVIFIYVFRLGIIWLAYVYLITSVIILISYIFYFNNKIGFIKIRVADFNLREAKNVFGFSFSIQLMNTFNTLIDPIIKYMISNFYNIGSVPAYEIAKRFAVAISGLFFNTFKIILPKASSLKTPQEIISFLKNEIIQYSKIGVIYSGLSFGIFLFPVILIIHIVFNIKEALLIFMILALPESVNNFGYSIYNFLLGRGKVRILVIIQFFNLISVIIGFSLFHNVLGLIGYFFSVSVANISMIIYIHRVWDIPLSVIYKKSKLYKLLLLIILMCFSTIVFYYNWISNIYLFPSISIVSMFIFYSDLKEILIQFIAPAMHQYKK